MRPLIIDDTARARVAEVEEFAASNWYRPGKSEQPPGDDQRHCVTLNTYRCVFSYTVAPPKETLWRHLSISVPAKKYPNPFAAFAIADLFGFTGWDGKSPKPPEDWVCGLDELDHCVVVVQRVSEVQKS